MDSKQKKTLLGGIVALILVATIVLVALGVSGYFSPCDKTPSVHNADAVKEVLKAVEEAMAKVAEGKEFQGGVYIKVQEQYLGKDKKPIGGTEVEIVDKTKDERKEIKRALLSVTVYGIMEKGLGPLAAVRVIKEEQKDAVVVGKAVEFKDVTVEFDKEEDYPVLKQLLEKYQVKGHVHQTLFRSNDGKVGVQEEKDVRMYFKPIEKKSG